MAVIRGDDPKTIAKLLRAIANGSDAKANKHDVIFNAAADLLDPQGELAMAVSKKVKPLYFVKGDRVFQRPIEHKEQRSVSMGFCVCIVVDGVDPAEVCAILNRGEPATE